MVRSVINNDIDICLGCMFGTGAVAVRDNKERRVYMGAPVDRQKIDKTKNRLWEGRTITDEKSKAAHWTRGCAA